MQKMLEYQTMSLLIKIVVFLFVWLCFDLLIMVVIRKK